MSGKTAIAIFAYKRAWHLEQTLISLSHCKEFASLDVILYLDGPKNKNDNKATEDVYMIAKMFAASHPRFQIARSSVNKGLFKSITQGVSHVLDFFDSIIVSEDDLIFSPFALEYFVESLQRYRDNHKIASIHGYIPNISDPLPASFFLRGADCWGWATWKDRWNLFRDDAKNMAREIRSRGLRNEFTLNANYDYLTLLDKRAALKSNSWAICWHASCFLANKLTLYPGRSLINNIGQDGSGEHCQESAAMNTSVCDEIPASYPISALVSPKTFNIYCSHFYRHKSLVKKLISRVRFISNKYLDRNSCHYGATFSLQGPFTTYKEALTNSTGYSHAAIIDKVVNATIGLLENLGSYERDGMLFGSRPKNLVISKILSKLVNTHDSILDFGGGLGGTYLNHLDVFQASNKYVVIEQDKFVKCGLDIVTEFKIPINFANSIDEIDFIPKIAILSAVLPYLEDPYLILSKIANLQPKFILIDRTAFALKSQWWLQNEQFYYDEPVSYPFHPLNQNKLLQNLANYKLIRHWRNDFDPQKPAHIGMLLERSTRQSTLSRLKFK